MVLLGFTLGLFEIVFFSGFFLLLLVGISFDRQGREDPKWYVFGIGMAALAAWFWKDWTFFGLFVTIRTWAFWEPMLAYLAAGIVYSILEFVLNIRRSARNYKTAWEYALGQPLALIRDDRTVSGGRTKEVITLKEALARAVVGEDAAAIDAAKEAVSRFVDRNSSRNVIVELSLVEGTPEPRINKIQLSEHIGAWTFFWPFYMISLVIGDLLTEIFNQLSEFFVSLSGRFVRMSFKDVFKF